MTKYSQAAETITSSYHVFDTDADVESIQRKLLNNSLLGPNHDTAYGKAYLYGDIGSAEAYRDRVPLVDYEDLRPWVDRAVSGEPAVLTRERIVAFFKTSGSLANPKLIPVTTQLMRQKVGAFAAYWGQIYKEYPAVQHGTLVSNFSDASDPEHTDAGIEVCSESGFWARRGRSLHSLNRWPLPREVRLLKDTDTRLFVTARFLLQSDIHCIMCLNPSTLLQFCRLLQTRAEELAHAAEQGGWGSMERQVRDALCDEDAQALESHLKRDTLRASRLRKSVHERQSLRIADIWPELDLVVCWCSAVVQPYFTLLAPFVEGVAIRDYITQSSECMMAIPFEDGSSGGALAIDTHFFEFIPEDEAECALPTTRFSWELETGHRYEIVVTTGGGLYRYRMGDCVIVNGFRGNVPVIEFLYRIGRTSSMTGEKLTEFQVMEAASSASQEVGQQPEEYLCFPCSNTTPHYGVLVDFGELPGDEVLLSQWVTAFDRYLAQANPEYAEKCHSGRLGVMQGWYVAPQSLRQARHDRRAAGVSEEQVKSEVLTHRRDIHLHFKCVGTSQ